MSWTPRRDPVAPWWLWAKWGTLAGALAVLSGLLMLPTQTNRLLWYAIIPLLPAVFLVNAEAWRNICPVATLAMLGPTGPAPKPLTRDAARRWTTVGIVLFAALVPLRLVTFEASAAATGMLLLGTCAAALVGGLLLDRKAGFCNSICPVLPVERLYGQRPLAQVANARCVPCRTCTAHACFDLNPERSGLVSLGEAARGRRWIYAPFGVFALGLPGFVAAYSLAASRAGGGEAFSAAFSAYGSVLAGAGMSWTVLALLFTALRVRPSKALIASAAAAVGTYYWFTPAAVVRAWSLDPAWVPALRLPALLLVTVWAWRALASRPPDASIVPVRLSR